MLLQWSLKQLGEGLPIEPCFPLFVPKVQYTVR